MPWPPFFDRSGSGQPFGAIGKLNRDEESLAIHEAIEILSRCTVNFTVVSRHGLWSRVLQATTDEICAFDLA